MKRCIQGFGGKCEGNRPLGRLKSGWEDNIKIDVQELGRGDMDWNDVAQDKVRWRDLVNAVINFWFP
jgi:hypothetical protein